MKKDDYNGYMREYMKKRAVERVVRAKAQLGSKCAKCNSVDNLEFDHIDPTTKLFTLAEGSSFSEKRWQAELAKCQLLCQPCHQLKTIGDLGHKIAKGNHGTISCYRYCRCDLCKAAKSEYSKTHRKRK